MTVTFLGHRDVYRENHIEEWLEAVVEQLLQQGADLFLLGGYGAFDRIAAGVVWEKKKAFSDAESILVLPYLNRKPKYVCCYDGTTYPPIETVPKRFAIAHRNRWMVDQSDVVIAYVLHDWGGAAAGLEYAIRRHKRIIQYPQDESV